MKRVIIVAVFAALISSCASAPSRSVAADPAERTKAIAEVVEASKAIVAAFGADDQQSYFKLFDAEAIFIFHNTPSRLEGRAAYEQEWESWRRDFGFKVRSCTSSDQKVQLVGEVAILTHSVQTLISTTEGDQTLHERETIVFLHRDGRWVAVHEHLSPLPGTP